MPPMIRPLVKPFLAELFGTFLLALTVGITAGTVNYYQSYEILYVPLIIGAVVGVLVYTLGPVSGAQFNPAVSVGLYAIRKISVEKLIAYVIAQIAGAMLAMPLIKRLLFAIPDAPTIQDASTGLIVEGLGALILVFVITRVVMGRVPEAVSGLVIGVALTVAITLSMFSTGGVLNPAIAIAWKASGSAYLLGPLLGGILGAFIAVGLDTHHKKED